VHELNSRFPLAGAYLQYFTLFYGVIDVRQRKLTYISAGHPPSLYVPMNGPPRFLNDCGFAVGWFDDAEFNECTLDLHKGDRLYLYSDGCTETMNPDSEQFGRERLARCCVTRRSAALQQNLALLLEQMKVFRGNAAVLDDVSALALEITW
jgi:sigma-B regulation protein RsbU (phosphoserine phosphatase)